MAWLVFFLSTCIALIAQQSGVKALPRNREVLPPDRIIDIFRDNPELVQRAQVELGSRTMASNRSTEEDVVNRIRSDARYRQQITAFLLREGYLEADDPDLTQDYQDASDLSSELDIGRKSFTAQAGKLETDDETDAEDAHLSAPVGSTRQEIGRRSRQTQPDRRESDRTEEPEDRRPKIVTDQRSTDEDAVTVRRRVAPYDRIPALRDLYAQTLDSNAKLKRFGAEAFADSTQLKATADVPAGPDYVLGAGDGLNIDLWGSVSRRVQTTVDREGRISLPEAGTLLIAGNTLTEARRSIQDALATQFTNIHSDVSLTRVRNVRIYVVGDVERPGAYDISALSTVVYALYAAGGPTSKGSLRHVKHFRGQTLVADIDIYELLLNGVRGQLAPLQPGDTILISPVGAQVAVSGRVRRPAIYELRQESDLKAVLDLAGGLLVSASLQDLRIERVQAHEGRRMIPVRLPSDNESATVQQALASYKIVDGDRIVVGSIPTYSDESVYLDGHVIAPGKYPYRPGMKVTDLVRSFKVLLPEPADRAEIVRLEAPDYRPRILEFDLRQALAGDSVPTLQPFDTVRVFGRYQYDAPKVSIYGDVLRPGEYPMSYNLTAAELLRLAGGFTRSAQRDSADLASYSVENGQKVEVDHRVIEMQKALSGVPDTDVRLKPGDVLTVHQLTGWSDIGSAVKLSGEVAHAGTYSIAEGEKLSSVLKRAGGFRAGAYPRGSLLLRTSVREIESKARNEMIRRIQDISLTVKPGSGTDVAAVTAAFAQQQQDMVRKLREQPVIGRQIIHISSNIAEWEGTSADIELRPGDELTVPKNPAFILIQGQVNNPAAMTYQKGKSAEWYLRQAGGETEFANGKGIFIVRANGTVVGRGGNSGWWGGGVLQTVLLPGDTLVVPEKIVSDNATWRGVMNTAQVMSSLAIAARVATTF